MSIEREFPILEFDPARETFISPHMLVWHHEPVDHCVICFFRDAITAIAEEKQWREVWRFQSETADLPVYVAETENGPVVVVNGFVGAAGSACLLEEMIAFGCKTFLVCGGAGVLQKDIAVGHLVIPDAAVRDEGASYHYVEPSREIACDPDVVERIAHSLEERGIPFLKGKTWTTDAFYRETRAKAELRVREGCLTVEMEAAALFAVAKFRGVRLGQILYGGDDLSGEKWDRRNWHRREDIRRNLLELCLDLCHSL